MKVLGEYQLIDILALLVKVVMIFDLWGIACRTKGTTVILVFFIA
jgi:hypothetical protein